MILLYIFLSLSLFEQKKFKFSSLKKKNKKKFTWKKSFFLNRTSTKEMKWAHRHRYTLSLFNQSNYSEMLCKIKINTFFLVTKLLHKYFHTSAQFYFVYRYLFHTNFFSSFKQANENFTFDFFFSAKLFVCKFFKNKILIFLFSARKKKQVINILWKKKMYVKSRTKVKETHEKRDRKRVWNEKTQNCLAFVWPCVTT